MLVILYATLLRILLVGETVLLDQTLLRAEHAALNIISDNTLTEWIIPTTSTNPVSDLAVDSNGNVFATTINNSMTRFVPSTGTFTSFQGNCHVILEIDSNDDIYCTSSSGILFKFT